MELRTEKQKMLAGELYSPAAAELVAAHQRALQLTRAFNAADETEPEQRDMVLGELIGRLGKNVEVKPGFRCDYGAHIALGDNVFINYDCTFLDTNIIAIGNNTILGPGVHIYAADHPRNPAVRRGGLEFSLPVLIGNNVWIGGRVIILSGVRIGDNSSIGAGSVVTKDVPANVVAAGNPCRVLRELKEGELP